MTRPTQRLRRTVYGQVRDHPAVSTIELLSHVRTRARALALDANPRAVVRALAWLEDRGRVYRLRGESRARDRWVPR